MRESRNQGDRLEGLQKIHHLRVGVHREIRAAEVEAFRWRRADHDDRDPRLDRGEHPFLGVLEDEALGRREVERIGRFQEHIGRGLDPRDRVAPENDVEQPSTPAFRSTARTSLAGVPLAIAMRFPIREKTSIISRASSKSRMLPSSQ